MGSVLHWGWALPPLEICSSNVLIRLVFLVLLMWKRRLIPVRPLLTAQLDEEGCVEHQEYLQSLLSEDEAGGEEVGEQNGSSHHGNGSLASSTDPFARGKQKKKEREQNEARRKQKTLLYIRNAIGIMVVASLFVFNWSSSVVLSQCILLVYFTSATQASFIVWAYTRSM